MYPSLWQILIILLILLLLFGHKRIRELGKSLGEGLRDFKKGLDGEEKEQPTPKSTPNTLKSAEDKTQNKPSAGTQTSKSVQETSSSKAPSEP